ncbi:hypothetical protein K490DRAFT_61166 [Saccharata proteae CBS 121410]|uniref:Zn(2)-C6 fungal-type domain-containing protein n=1 Tax=Saccharata proteae CBS 121410 TaxID=1314787 RepID=A0A9P4LZT0_9PEZI|nr:hypothetical protein K490DRAFT_61166 [Saccharata proteae CBS 121410]
MEDRTPNSSRRSRSPEDVPGDAHNEPRKRRRKALSCYDCRRRKLRCDREYPACTRCRKGGHPETCSYDARADLGKGGLDEFAMHLEADANDRIAILSPSTLHSAAKAGPEANDLLQSQRQKISELETRLAQLEGRSSRSSLSHNAMGQESVVTVHEAWPNNIDSVFAPPNRSILKEPAELETMLFRGKGFKTQFFGASNITSTLVTHFPGLRSFMQDAFMQNPSLVHGRTEMKASKARWKKHRQSQSHEPSRNLEDLLPTKDEADNLVTLYAETYERTYRILHMPTFWKDYEAFWRDPSNRRPEFTSILLAILATVSCATPAHPKSYCADSPLQRERAIEWVEACEAWLERQSAKHTDIGKYQLRCLVLLAKYTNAIKWKQLWPAARNLFTFGMAAGLHRDPRCLVKETTVFEQEMRRRLWATIVELELQGSVYRGMPASSQGLVSDCAAPLNVNDMDLEEFGRKSFPTAWPIQEYTEASFLHVSSKSLQLRVSINALVNNSSSSLSYDDALTYDRQLLQELGRIPSWTGNDAAVFPRTLLDMQLRQYLILLHNPFARQAGTNPRYAYSRAACMDAAAAILEQHSKLIAADCYALLLLRSDIVRSALSIIQNAFMSVLAQDHRFFQSQSNHISKLVDKALVLVEQKTIRTGAPFSHHWHISAAYNLLLAKVDPANREQRSKDTVERLMGLYRTISDRQEPIEQISGSLEADDGPTANEGPVDPTVADLQLPLDTALADPNGFDFSDLNSWALDDLWNYGPIEI